VVLLFIILNPAKRRLYSRKSEEIRSIHFTGKKMAKPIVLHLGDAIKYNHDFYNQEFLKRFEVVRNDAETREDFIDALKKNRYFSAAQIILELSIDDRKVWQLFRHL
jgi:hypothetical protein